MERRIQPRKKTLRRELECYVISCNTILKEAVKKMSIIILLRNAHPAFRPTYATQCQEAGMLTDQEAREFRTGAMPRQHSRTTWMP